MSHSGTRRGVLALVALVLIVVGVGGVVMYLDAEGAEVPLRGSGARLHESAPPAAPGPARSGMPAAPEAISASGRPGAGAGAGPTCGYRETDRGVGEQRLVPAPPSKGDYRGPVRATVRTNLGELRVELDADRAPCTVHSFLHLAYEDYYTETSCHRVTTSGIFVLQCGDPTGTGTGAPGYRYDEENLPTSTTPPYPRGTLAMANAGPGTNGGQFFVVYRDSAIPPDYTIFGRVVTGIDIAERVAAAGTDSGDADGHPALDIVIESITLD